MLTIHNIGYQGVFGSQLLGDLGLGAQLTCCIRMTCGPAASIRCVTGLCMRMR